MCYCRTFWTSVGVACTNHCIRVVNTSVFIILDIHREMLACLVMFKLIVHPYCFLRQLLYILVSLKSLIFELIFVASVQHQVLHGLYINSSVSCIYNYLVVLCMCVVWEIFIQDNLVA